MKFHDMMFDGARLEDVAVRPQARAAELVFAGVRRRSEPGGAFALRVRFAEVDHVSGLMDLAKLQVMSAEGNVSGGTEHGDAPRLRWSFPLAAGCLMIEGAGVELERL